MNVKSLGFEIGTEMAVKMLKRRLLVKEVPITCRRRENHSSSKLHIFKDGYRILKTTFQAYFAHQKNKL